MTIEPGWFELRVSLNKTIIPQQYEVLIRAAPSLCGFIKGTTVKVVTVTGRKLSQKLLCGRRLQVKAATLH